MTCQPTELTRADVTRAHGKIQGRVKRTPVLSSQLLDDHYGLQLFFKAEHLQSSGAFKFRGASHCLSLLSNEEKKRGVVTHSSGNHAQALALAAARAGVTATIVMPEGSNPLKKSATEAYGARVVSCENNQDAREATAAREVKKTGGTLIHPYDDWRIITGAGTAALEFLEEVPDLDAIVTPLGGGGLLAGTCLAASEQCKVFGAEPEGADDGHRGFYSGTRVVSQTPDTICDGLRTCVGELNFSVLQHHLTGIGVASDEECVSAQWQIMTRMKQVIEPSSAVALACIANESIPVSGKVGIIISGGNLDMGPWFCPSTT